MIETGKIGFEMLAEHEEERKPLKGWARPREVALHRLRGDYRSLKELRAIWRRQPLSPRERRSISQDTKEAKERNRVRKLMQDYMNALRSRRARSGRIWSLEVRLLSEGVELDGLRDLAFTKRPPTHLLSNANNRKKPAHV
jgi:hypothetical protein